MQIPLNEAQIAVLKWVDDGRPDGVYDDGYEHRITARALERRGLVEVRGHGAVWSAEISDDGRYYLVHGNYPNDDTAIGQANVSPRPKPPIGPPPTAPSQAADEKTEPASTAAPSKPKQVGKDETIPIPSQIRKPHPAMRELIDHKKRVGVPIDARQRALLILHALVQESQRRGWTVTPAVSEMHVNSWNQTRTRVWPNGDLFTIDAGNAPTSVRLRMKTRRVDHVLTEKEAKDEARGGYSWAPRHDYIPTTVMRLEIGANSSGSLVIEDTAATSIEGKLLRAIERVGKMTEQAIARDEARRRNEIEREHALRTEEVLRTRALHYKAWATTLEELHSAYVKHRDLTALVEDLHAVAPTMHGSEHADRFRAYLAWATRYLEHSDPLRSIPLPSGDQPDLTYPEWERWRAHNQQYFR